MIKVNTTPTRAKCLNLAGNQKATTVAEKGIEDLVIKVLGRWESWAYQLYVRSSREMLLSILRRLVQVS